MSTAIRSAADIEEVGWPLLAIPEQRTASTRSCWPTSFHRSTSVLACSVLTSLMGLLGARVAIFLTMLTLRPQGPTRLPAGGFAAPPPGCLGRPSRLAPAT